MKLNSWALVFVGFLFAAVACVVLGQDPTPPVPPAAAPWWLPLVQSESVWSVVGQVALFLMTFLPAKGWLNGKVTQSIQAGVNEVYREVIKPIRDQAIKDGADHKIDAETAQQYNAMAIESAKKSGGILVRIAFKMLGPEVLRLLIERAVGTNKRLHATPDPL